MSNEKLKSENYALLGGINAKASPYVTGPMEFLDLVNLDFQQPGSLSERWGSTMYVGQTFPGQINSLFEFNLLSGSSYLVSSYSGGIHFGATTGNAQGVSFTALNATTTAWGAVNALVIATPNGGGANRTMITPIGAYYLGSTLNALYGLDPDGSYGFAGGTGTPFYINPVASHTDNILSSGVLSDRMYLADGSKFLKFDGASMWPVGLPPPLWATNGAYSPLSNLTPGFGTVTSAGGSGIGFAYGPSIGTYYLFASYVNNRGFEGPVWPWLAVVGDNQYNASLPIVWGGGGTNGIISCSTIIATPLQYGISTIKIYSFYEQYNPAVGQTYLFRNNDFYASIQARFWNIGNPVLMQTIPASGSTFTSFALGVTNQTLLQANQVGPVESIIPNSYYPLGLTLPVSELNRTTYGAMTFEGAPKFVEIYANRLFSLKGSKVTFSDIAEPEGYASDGSFEVRTNDGDTGSCLRAYSTRLYIFKRKSFHALSGDSPTNFFLTELSAQYGCLNNRCAVIYDDILIFLDQKGVLMWNGASLSVISLKIQPIIDRINYAVALNTACMEHDKLRNQILISVPIDGATLNNITLVFDYTTGAWTTYKGLSISSLRAVQGRNNTKNLFYGSHSGSINWFGPSFLSDNGTGFTTVMKTRFLHELGDSTQKMYRRLYLNTDAPSATLTFSVNFYQDYGTSIVLGSTIVLSQFQNRIDFGISAKSLAFEMANIQTSVPLKINGFTIESRYLRRV